MTDPGSLELRYVLVSPCRDESKHMRRTLDSVAAQTVPPALWVVVDDGSTDATPAVLDDTLGSCPTSRSCDSLTVAGEASDRASSKLSTLA
jgi:cellulose synthase/poly-beta-1,6-N-acetylglucosamine synthase-like glycosyltransferase